jgi:hypothetical protein
MFRQGGSFGPWKVLNYFSKALSHFYQENGIINILNILLILSKSPPGGR